MTADLAPEELPALDALAEFDDDVIVRRLQRGERRERLGWGLGDFTTLTAPVVWIALDQLARRTVDGAANGAAKRVGTVVRRVFRRAPAPKVLPPLSQEQLNDVRQLVLAVASERGLSSQRATTIADAVVARLALAEVHVDARSRSGDPDRQGGQTEPS